MQRETRQTGAGLHSYHIPSKNSLSLLIIPEFQIAWCPSLSHSALRSYAVVGPLGVVSLPYWNFLLFPVCCELDERSTLYLLTSGEHDSIAHNPPPRGFQILFRLRAHFPFWFFICHYMLLIYVRCFGSIYCAGVPSTNTRTCLYR